MSLEPLDLVRRDFRANFPREYDIYRRTVDMERTKFGGSEADPAAPNMTTSKLVADPRLKTLWNGCAFAVDFREERGHAYMLKDQKATEQQKVVAQPGACPHRHASTAVACRQAGLDAGAAGEAKESLLSFTRNSLWWLHEGHRAFRVGDWKPVAANKESWELDTCH